MFSFSDKELPSHNVTKHFNETSKEMKLVLQSFKKSLTNRIDSLKLFLETEHNEAKIEIEKRKSQKLLEMKEQLEQEKIFAAFGKPSRTIIFILLV